MPDRIVRAGINTSERVNRLGWAEEVFYRRLMNAADDYGRYDGRDSILRATLYPLKLDSVSERDVGKWKLATAKAGLVKLYQVDGKEYVELLNFNQRVRRKSKYPSDADCRGQLAADCGEVPQSAADCGEVPPYSYSDSDAHSDADALTPLPPKGGGRFVSPTVDEVRAYCRERKNRVDAATFVDHYTAKGWVVGKSPMRDWRAAVRTWEKNDGTFAGRKPGAIHAGPGQIFEEGSEQGGGPAKF